MSDPAMRNRLSGLLFSLSLRVTDGSVTLSDPAMRNRLSGLLFSLSLRVTDGGVTLSDQGERSVPPSTAELRMKKYYVYIMTNRSRTLYTGITNDLNRRVYEHKHKLIPGFTSRYNITLLVYFEETTDVKAAIAREKQIKGWLRAKKIALIESVNPRWQDLSAGWYR
ncbi:MAG: GIY-YIG nuclease family protein [Chloroflexota bacterium]